MTRNGHVDLAALPIEKRVKALRQEMGLYQWELADLIGYEVRQLKRYESGEVIPTEDAAHELARVAPKHLKASPELFFEPREKREERMAALERRIDLLERRLRKAGL
jgi:transcriptional regulator with XRE-family HTH domain